VLELGAGELERTILNNRQRGFLYLRPARELGAYGRRAPTQIRPCFPRPRVSPLLSCW
jgi:hypothetical protein